mgnify:CR=1 FL=1
MTINQRIQQHYKLSRSVTNAEVEAEIANLQRRGLSDLDDSQIRLASALIYCHNIDIPTRQP